MSATRTPANKKAAAAKKGPVGLRAALKSRKSRQTHYDIPIVDSDVADAAAKKVAQLTGTVNLLRATDGKKEDLERAQKQIDEARAELAQCFHRIHFQGLPAEDYDALLNEHPPTEEQKQKAGDEEVMYNPDTFIPALLSACYVGEDGMTPEEWVEELAGKEGEDGWPWADQVDLHNTVLYANARPFSHGIPKD